VSAFSTVALTSAGIVTFTGVVSAKLRLGSWIALVTSAYGLVLILKVLLVFGVAAIGWFNWKKVRPALAAGDGVDLLRKAARAELGMALLVIIATSVLVALPTPASP
jgi:putative copper export protein